MRDTTLLSKIVQLTGTTEADVKWVRYLFDWHAFKVRTYNHRVFIVTVEELAR